MSAIPWLVGLGAGALATRALIRLAPRLGLEDAAEGPDAGRKLQQRPVALIGGLALALGTAAGLAASGLESPLAWLGAENPFGFQQPGTLYKFAALILALVAGLVDDWLPHGLRAGQKLAWQCLPALALSLPLARESEWAGAAAWFALALAAQNAINTFDNADGAASLLCALGLALPVPCAAAALLGFLPFNLARESSGRPKAYLGDSGSHFLGILIACHPAAWGALVLPLLDLARLSVVRVRAGARPWQGDRRHLAHRMAARGLRPAWIALALAFLALPAITGCAAGARLDRGWPAALGLAATAALYWLALRLAPDP